MGNKVKIHRKRHVAKTITWRIIGTLDTFIIGKFLMTYTGHEEYSTEAAGLIAILELITKTILYYFHERVWYISNWGIIKDSNVIKSKESS